MLVLLTAGSAVGAIVILRSESWQANLSVEMLSKVLLSAPFFVLSYYFAHEARRHTEAAMGAREIEVRLKSLDAYTAALNERTRDAVRGAFGVAVFGLAGSTATGSTSDDQNVPGRLTSLVSLVEALQGNRSK